MRRTDHFNGIEIFIATAKYGSFSAASEKLGLTKSAVAKSVGRLEERLGIKLFQRSTRRLSLTSDGERYLEKTQYIVSVLQQVESEITSHASTFSGPLRIDLPAAFGRKKILPNLLNVLKENNKIRMTVTFSERLIDPIDEGIDLLVRIGELADSSGLVYRKLTTQKLVICAAPEYLHANGYPKEITDIAKHQCIVGLRKNKPKTWIFKENDNELIRYAPSSIQVFADGDAMLAAVLAGCGISQLPLWLVEEYIATGELVVVLDNYSGAEVPINLLWPKEKKLSPKIRYLIDLLVEKAEEGLFG